MTPRRFAMLALCGLPAVAVPFTVVPTRTAASTPIQHVVVLLQENHSFDNLLGAFCVQRARCDGTTTGVLYGGAPYQLGQATDIVPDVGHLSGNQKTAVDGGAMDGFSQIQGCTATVNYRCLTQFQPSQIPNVAALAQSFAISDRTFEMQLTPSWGAHLDLAAATLDGFTGDIPSNPGTRSAQGWGCDSGDTTIWHDPSGAKQTVPSCVPKPDGTGAFEPTPVRYVPTIMDRLQAAGLDWKLYTGGAGHKNTTGYGWAMCPSFAECLASQSASMVPNGQVVTDAQAGTLPAFSIVTPDQVNSQHNGDSMTVGDDWIGQVVGAIEHGPEWSSTTIFLGWDDCGCFYDHVSPPNGLGIRLPEIIVSPYARAGYTDSTVATFASALAYTEHTFGLAPLNATDGSAYDYSNAFNYAQAPLPPVAVATHSISAAEQAQLSPPDPTDPS